MEYYNNSKRPKKPMTEQQALLKLTTLCTQAEHCSQEMLDKMKKWELPEDAIARNMEFLTQKKFIKIQQMGPQESGTGALDEAHPEGNLRPNLRRNRGRHVFGNPPSSPKKQI